MQNKAQTNFFMRALNRQSNHCDLMKIPFDCRKSGAKVFLLCLLGLFTLLWCPLAESQESIRHPRIGFLSSGFPPPHSSPLDDSLKVEGPRLSVAFHEGLRELGYIEAKNIFIEYRYGKGQPGRLLEFAEELVRLKVDVIVAPNTESIAAAKRSTSKIPIVMLSGTEPVPRFVDSLARPGGNITGVSGVASKLSGKLLELITEAVPEATRVGVLWQPVTPAESLRETEIAARALGRQLQIVEVPSHYYPSKSELRNSFGKAMLALSEKRAGAVVVLPAILFGRNQTLIAELAVKNRLPTIFHQSQFADAGGLMAYGARWSDLWRRAGVLVGKILKGAKPADLPVEQPMKFELVINLKIAKALGLKIPAHLLMEADRVIE
jgi:putative ABC transport system substrate-binding protein